jgi:hypothetical protein
MQGTDSALRGTAATPELWGGVYMMLVFALLSRGLHAWETYGGQPFGWEQGLAISVELIFCPAPLLMGLAFRRLVKNELRKNLLNSRTYKIVNFWIAQLLILTYIAMVL